MNTIKEVTDTLNGTDKLIESLREKFEKGDLKFEYTPTQLDYLSELRDWERRSNTPYAKKAKVCGGNIF